jgi:hypothetical protein
LYVPNRVKLKIIARDQCQIALKQKLLRKFKKWHKFSSHAMVKSCKKKSHKTRLAMYM